MATDLKVLDNTKIYAAVEPDYKSLIHSRKLRRMNKLVKMSHFAVLKLLQELKGSEGNEAFKSVITSTGLGCLVETVKFLKTIENGEASFLSPAAFINSTHNTPGGYLSNAFNCKGYNMTHTQRDISFEMALLDAALLPKKEQPVLVGGFDELETNTASVLEYAGFINEDKTITNSWKVPYSEGASYFLLGDQTDKKLPKIISVEVIRKEISKTELMMNLEDKIKSFQIKGLNNGFVFSGNNKAEINENKYEFLSQVDKSIPIIDYKKWTGEFASATPVALDLAVKILKGDLDVPSLKNPEFAILYNYTLDGYHSLITISK